MKTRFLISHFAYSTVRLFAAACLLLVLMLGFLPQQAVRAAMIRYAIAGGATSGACNSWQTACDLQYALTNSSSGEIWVKAGTYTPTSGTDRNITFQLKNGVELYGGFSGSEITRNQRDPATNLTILSGEIGGTGTSDNSYHVVTGNSIDATAILDGFIITGGNANGTDPNDQGGGMYNNIGSPTLSNLTFNGNSADHGGGIYNYTSSPTLTNITLIGNTAFGWDGGGLYNDFNSSPTLTNATFSGNTANWDGGGMYNYYSNPTLINVTFSDNAAGWDGGGMENFDFSSPMLSNVTFSGNSAINGGGMHNSYYSSPLLFNVTFNGNFATQSGGGLVNDNQCNPTLTNVTLSGNSSAINGGGMMNSNNSNPILQNSILWGNTALTGSQVYNDNSTTTITYSDVQGGCPAGSSCSNYMSADPFLGALEMYGGSTQVFPLLPGSPAIDAGNNATCAATDQRNVSRPQGAGCDMGSFESRGFMLAITGGNNQRTFIGTIFTQPLVLSISSAFGEPINGGVITFTTPANGASAILSSNLATIADGAVNVTATANTTVGAYSVTADATGISSPVTFHLTNIDWLKLFLPSIFK